MADTTSRWYGTVTFLLFAFILSVIGVLTARPEISFLTFVYNYSNLVLFFSIVLLGIISIAFGLDGQKDISSIIATTSYFTFIFAPMIMIMTPVGFVPQAILFWISLAIWGILAAVFVSNSAKGWAAFLLKLSAITTVVSLFCKIGEYGPITFAAGPLSQVTVLNHIIDVRMGATYLIVLLFVATAIQRTLPGPSPSIPDVPFRDLPHATDFLPSFLAAMFEPFIIVVNGILRLTVFCLNLIWKTVATIAVYCYHTGLELGKLVCEVFINGRALFDIGRVCILLLLVVGALVLAKMLVIPVSMYITSDSFSEGMTYLYHVAALSALALGTIAGIIIVVRNKGFAMNNLLFGVSFIIIAILVAGAPLHLATRQRWIEINGFHLIGPFSGALLVVVCLGFVVLIVRRVREMA